ncbi:N-alpha-acetyltransferase 20-like protein [Aphelenchoides fujianensis]|nr:N-alpha-acetyltransferase 20-like protein [Aphelenchoides fujianensis]
MKLIREFLPADLLNFNIVNLDKFTETYSSAFYLSYNCNFPEYFLSWAKPRGEARTGTDTLGYVIYRRIVDYYSGENGEDAYDMRKALPRDVERKSVIPLKHPVHSSELEDD